jgi:lipocalin
MGKQTPGTLSKGRTFKVHRRKLTLAMPDENAAGEDPVLAALQAEMPAVQAHTGDEQYSGKKGRLVLRTCAELYATELQYAHDLRCALRLYRDPLEPTLSERERQVVFSNMAELSVLSSELLRELQADGDPLEVIAAAFTKVAPFYMLYVPFCTNYDRSLVELGQMKRDVTGLNAWLHLQAQSAEARGLTLESFLIKPIQRLTKYHLFFDQLLHAATEGAAKRALGSAAGQMHTISTKVNIKAADLSRKAQSLLLELGEVWLQLLAPYTQLILEFKTTLEYTADAASGGDRAYKFGDLTKKGLAKMAGKQPGEYKFGDVTRRVFAGSTQEAEKPLSRVNPLVAKALELKRQEEAASTSSASSSSAAPAPSPAADDAPAWSRATLDLTGYLFSDFLLLCREDGKRPTAFLLAPLEKIDVSVPGASGRLNDDKGDAQGGDGAGIAPGASSTLAGQARRGWGALRTATACASAVRSSTNGASDGKANSTSSTQEEITGGEQIPSGTAASRWAKVRTATACAGAMRCAGGVQQRRVSQVSPTALVLTVALAGTGTGDRLEDLPTETFELNFETPKAKEHTRNALLTAKAADRDGSESRERHKASAAPGDEKRVQVSRVLALALKEDRVAGTVGAGASLKRACRELAHTRTEDHELSSSLQAVSRELRLHRLMGKWFVLSSTGDDDAGARNATETHEWDGKAGVIRTALTYEEAGTGRARTTRRTAWLHNIETSAEWRVKGALTQQVWPLILLECPEDYSLVMLGDPNRSFLKICARQPLWPDGRREQLLQLARDLGYEVTTLESIEHTMGGISTGVTALQRSASRSRVFTRKASAAAINMVGTKRVSRGSRGDPEL